jgi:hypothetical protein
VNRAGPGLVVRPGRSERLEVGLAFRW